MAGHVTAGPLNVTYISVCAGEMSRALYFGEKGHSPVTCCDNYRNKDCNTDEV